MTDADALQWKKNKPGVWFLYEGLTKIAMIEQIPAGTYSATIFEFEKPAPSFDDFDSAVSYVEGLCVTVDECLKIPNN
jgi:hypothetical protein